MEVDPNLTDRVHERVKQGGGTALLADKVVGPLVRYSPSFFAVCMLRGPQRPPYNGKFIIGPHHLLWDRLIVQHDRFAAVASRGIGKSHMFSFALPIWGAIVNPKGRQLLIASIDDNAKRVMRELRDEIEDNPLLRWLLPERSQRQAWTTHDMQLRNSHWLYSRSSGTKVRGLHPDRVIGDDILADEAKYSEVYRRKIADWWHSVVEPMPMAGGQIALVGTVLHMNDLLYGDLRKNTEYVYQVFTAMDAAGNPAWPEHMDAAQIASKRNSMGPIRFDCEMRCVPVSDDTSICPRRLFEANNQYVHSAILGMPRAHYERMGCSIYMGVDFAFSAAASADYFVIFVMAVDADGNRWWVDIFRDKGLSFQRQQDIMKDYGYRYQPELMYLEANQAQQIISQEMIRTTDLNIRKFVTTAAKHKFEAGIPRLALLAENAKWRIPRGDARSQELTNVAIDELSSMTYSADSGKIISVGEHDDIAMACVVPGSFVTTDTGSVPIEHVAEGARVLTHKGNWRRVTGTMRRFYEGHVVDVKVVGRQIFSLTPEHPMLRALPRFFYENGARRTAPDESTWAFVPAESLDCGRKDLAQYAKIPIPKWPSMGTQVDLSQYMDFSRAAGGGACWKMDDKSLWWRKDRRHPRFIDIDADAAFLIGLYLAEGSTGGGGPRKGNKRHVTNFGFAQKEDYLHDFVVRESKRLFNVDASIIHSSTDAGTRVNLPSVVATSFFRQFGSWREIHMTPWIMGLPQRLLRWVVRGWFCGDGHLGGQSERLPYNSLRGVSISRRLIDQIRWILASDGIAANVCPFKQSRPNALVAQNLSIDASSTSLLLNDMNPEEKMRWLTYRRRPADKPTNRRSYIVSDGHAVAIASLTRRHYTGLVHNLMVDDDESYTVEGVAVHNCWIASKAVDTGGNYGLYFDDPDAPTQNVPGAGPPSDTMFHGPDTPRPAERSPVGAAQPLVGADGLNMTQSQRDMLARLGWHG